MNPQCDTPAINSRTPNNNNEVKEERLRISLLSASTSGIENDDGDDSSSVESDSFSNTDLGADNRDQLKANKYCVSLINVDEGRNIKASNEKRQYIYSKSIEDVAKTEAKKALPAKPTIPDGGWGWVVVFSSFVISMIADGISFSFGLLYTEFLEEFKASKSVTAWIGSLFIAVPLLSGPVMSALVDRYGCRSMTVLGGIISTIGFILASVANSLEMMMISFGIIAGLGLGLVYVTAVVSIAYWFEKKRNLAVGLGACGTGVGTFVYAPMTQYFIEEYGWRGTILLLSGTLLNLCVCGAVMRDPEWWILEQKKENIDKNQEKTLSKNRPKSRPKLKIKSNSTPVNPQMFSDQTLSHGKRMKELIEKGIAAETVIANEVAWIYKRQNLTSLKDKNREKQNKRKISSISMECLPSFLTYSDQSCQLILEEYIKLYLTLETKESQCPDLLNKAYLNNISTMREEFNSPPVVTYPRHLLMRTHSEKYDHRKEKTLGTNLQLKNPKARKAIRKAKETKIVVIKQDSKNEKRDWLLKQFSVHRHYLRDLKMPINSLSHRNAMLNIKKYRLRASSCPDIFKNSMITINEKEQKWYDDCLSCLSDMFNVSLIKKPTFDLLCLGTIILFIWFIVPYFYLAEHMKEEGYTEDDGAFMLSVIGITNTIGMVGLGWIGDFPKVTIGTLYAVCLVLCGVSVASIPWATSSGYWHLVTTSSAFGLLFAASFTFTPSLLVKLVSLEDFTSAYGLVLLAQGIGHLVGPPLSGLIYDVTNSWVLSFYLAGGWIVIAGILISLIQPVRVYQARRIQENKDSPSA